jgi:glycosyltransferase involved in cell wall biosynthesis
MDEVMNTVLYITYDGLTDPLGQSQVLPYLTRLSRYYKIVILSYEKPGKFELHRDEIRKTTDQFNIEWVPLSYTKNPPILSSLLDVRKGWKACKQLHQKFNFHLVHCRGYLASILGRRLKKTFGIKFIFDMRGWWADEKKESGHWDIAIYQPVYKYFKRLEKKFFKDCDYAVSLTHRGKDEISKQNLAEPSKIGVVPTCVDFEIFKPRNEANRKEMREKLGIEQDEKAFVYSGSLGGNYAPGTLISVFKKFKQKYPKSYLLILSKDGFDEAVKKKFFDEGINRISIHNSSFNEVTNYLRAADTGFIYYKISFSTIGRSPTKLGEYWASGIPVISFKNIGDLDYIFEKYPGGGVLLSANEANWLEELDKLNFDDPNLLRDHAEQYFHIDKGVKFYKEAYEKLLPATTKVYEQPNVVPSI